MGLNKQVTFSIAKLLKEKGFDRITNKSYRVSINPEIIVGEPITDENTYFPNVKESYSAPTIADVVMWLYEKYGIWIYTRPFSSGYFHGYIVDNSGEMKEAINTINFNSPTEAYEAAIEYTLKNLI